MVTFAKYFTITTAITRYEALHRRYVDILSSGFPFSVVLFQCNPNYLLNVRIYSVVCDLCAPLQNDSLHPHQFPPSLIFIYMQYLSVKHVFCPSLIRRCIHARWKSKCNQFFPIFIPHSRNPHSLSPFPLSIITFISLVPFSTKILNQVTSLSVRWHIFERRAATCVSTWKLRVSMKTAWERHSTHARAHTQSQTTSNYIGSCEFLSLSFYVIFVTQSFLILVMALLNSSHC